MKSSLIGLSVALSVLGGATSAGSLADPVVSPQVVAADAIDTSSKSMHEMLALLTVTLILTTVMTSR